MISLIFLIPLGAGALLVPLLMFFALRHYNKARLIEDTPFCKVRDLPAGGAVKVEGAVVALEDPIRSPMAGTACVYYRFKIEEQRTRTVSTPAGPRGGTNMRTETYWATIIDDVQFVRCAVEDSTGTAEVDLEGADVVLTTSNRRNSGTMNEAPESLQRTLRKRYGQSTKGWIFNRTLRYTESVIEEGDDLFVLGTVKRGKDGVRLVKTRERPLLVSDKEEHELVKRYKRRALYCGIGMAATAVLAAALAGFLLVVTAPLRG